MRTMRIGAILLVALSMNWAAAVEPPPRPTAAGPSAPTVTASNPQFHIRPVDDAWRTSLPRSAEAATKAYMDRLPPEIVARANSYF